MEQPNDIQSVELTFTIPFVSEANGLRYDANVDLTLYANVIDSEETFKAWIIPYVASYDEYITKKDFDVFDFLDELKQEIIQSKNKNCRLATFLNNKKRFISWWNSIKKDYSDFELETYSPKIEKSIQWIDETQKKSTLFLIHNMDIVFEMIDAMILEHKEKLKHLEKTARQKYNKKKYAEKKALFNIPDKVILTPEERAEHRKESYKKYYHKNREGIEKRVPLTEEQRRENRRLTQKKYTEKMKQKKLEQQTINGNETI
jgi:hypothetical protein